MSTPTQPPGPPPGPPYGPPPVQPKPPKSKPFGWVAMIIAVVAALAVGGAIGGAGKSTTAAPAPGPTVTVTAKAAPVEEPKKPAEEEEPPAPEGLGDGTYEVGVDVEPGRYKTVVPADSPNCYWARLKDDSGELSAIIANDNKEPKARVSVTIKKSDGFFTSTGCGDWVKS